MKTLSSLSQALLSVTLVSVVSFGSLLGGCAAATEEDLADESGSTSDAIKSDGTASGSANAGTGKAVPPIAPVDPPVCPPPPKECQPTDCGPVPLKPALQCEDGSAPPPPVCVGTVGKCSWSYGTCPATGVVLSGDWGGKDISLTATPVKGENVSNIRVELPCARVLFSIGPIGKDGTFKSTAGYFASGSNIAEKVIVSGGLSTSGTQLKIEITDLNGKLIGAYLLDKGKIYPFYKCD